jgi:ABC-2 type transport system permease protein
MGQTLTIARRELASLFLSPIAYVVLGLFALGTSLIFFMNFGPGQPATMRGTFQWVVWLMILLVPAISMRLLSEELRSGTIETMMTAPVSDLQVITGKWIGALGFFAALLLPLLVHAGLLEAYADPEYGPILTGLLGLVLVGGLYLAIGTFASALTENQVIAFLITVFVISLLTLMLYFLPQAGFLSPEAAETLREINVNMQFEDFNKGLIDSSNFVYFLTGIALFLFVAVRTLESKRWR